MNRASLRMLVACITVLGAMAPGGCAASPGFGSPAQDAEHRQSTPSDVQRAVSGFADRYLSAMADAYDRARALASTPAGELAANQGKVQAGLGALNNAVNPNPLAGLMDMAILVTLTRETTEDPWARDAFGPEGISAILDALKSQEADVWRVASMYLTSEQLKELRQLADHWRAQHPEQRYVAGVRLSDFPEADTSDNPAFRLADSVFGIIRLDPFAGLDPAVRQVEQSRVLGERMFFYARHTSMLVSWQAESLYMRMIDAPQVRGLLDDTSRFTQNTGRFTDATREFADASARLSETVEKFRAELPAQQATLVGQVEAAVARQRDEALRQASAEIAAQRDAVFKQLAVEVAAARDAALKQAAAEVTAERAAAIAQLNTAVTAQQDLMTRNLQSVMDTSIDRLYARARSLVLIVIVGAVAAIVGYRIVASLLPRRGHASEARSA